MVTSGQRVTTQAEPEGGLPPPAARALLKGLEDASDA